MTTGNEVFGLRVRRLRGHNKWSLRQLHAASGVGINTLSRVENGGDMYMSSARRLATVFGLSLGDLDAAVKCEECLDVPAPRTSCTVCGCQSPSGLLAVAGLGGVSTDLG